MGFGNRPSIFRVRRKVTQNSQSKAQTSIRINWNSIRPGIPNTSRNPTLGRCFSSMKVWSIKNGAYQRTVTNIETPLLALDRLAGYVSRRDRRGFNRQVPARLRCKLWKGIQYRMVELHFGNDSDDEAENQFQMGPEGDFISFAKVNVKWWVPHRWFKSDDYQPPFEYPFKSKSAR